MTSLLCVRSVVPAPGDRHAFDEWYGKEHAMTAYKDFAPIRLWRCWSETDASVHYAFYEFESLERINDVAASKAFADLVDDYTNTWGSRVSRSREILRVTHTHP